MSLTTKEKKEIALILGSVLLVAIVGLVTTQLTANRVEAIAGAAVRLNPDVPTYPGTMILLKEYCSPVRGSGDCDSICGERVCVPTQENCNVAVDNNQCLCCSNP